MKPMVKYQLTLDSKLFFSKTLLFKNLSFGYRTRFKFNSSSKTKSSFKFDFDSISRNQTWF